MLLSAVILVQRFRSIKALEVGLHGSVFSTNPCVVLPIRPASSLLGSSDVDLSE